MLIIGCGRLGGTFARIWREREPEDRLVCTVRRATSRASLEGLDARVLDLLDADAVREIVAGQERILVSVVGEEAWTAGVRNLAAVVDQDAHVVYISSTGVYAGDGGAEVREGDALVAGAPLVVAEEALEGLRATVLRCSGLVDPDAEPRRMLEAFAGSQRPDGWINLVRRDDVAEVIAESFARSLTGTFNVSATTIRRSEYIDPKLAALGLEPVDWMAGRSGKRVDCGAYEQAFRYRLRAVS